MSITYVTKPVLYIKLKDLNRPFITYVTIPILEIKLRDQLNI